MLAADPQRGGARAGAPELNGARGEYEELAWSFRALAEQFDLDLDRDLEQDLVLLAAAFEIGDRHLDSIPRATDRRALGDAILRALEGAPTDLAPELARAMRELRALLVRRRAESPFTGALARFFEDTETLRTTRRSDVFVRCVLEEGRRASEMLLAIASPLRARRFPEFFLALSEVANLVDKLHDVRDDRRRGEIEVRPGAVLHARLAWAFAVRSARLLSMSPRPLHLALWGARYVLFKPPSSSRSRAPSSPSRTP